MLRAYLLSSPISGFGYESIANRGFPPIQEIGLQCLVKSSVMPWVCASLIAVPINKAKGATELQVYHHGGMHGYWCTNVVHYPPLVDFGERRKVVDLSIHDSRFDPSVPRKHLKRRGCLRSDSSD